MEVEEKVQAIFRELAGEAAERLKGDRYLADVNSRIREALLANSANSSEDEARRLDSLGFHLIDWQNEAAFIVALALYPDRFTNEEIRDGVEALLWHAPAHILEAARLGGYPAENIFAQANKTAEPTLTPVSNPEVRAILDRVRDTADFGYVDFSHINATNHLGENALHCVIVWDDLESARILLDNGININQRGEFGFTPLHLACEFGRKEMVRLLLERGVDIYTRSAGDQPFTLARLSGHNDICDLISEYARTRPNPQHSPGDLGHQAHIQELTANIAVLEKQVRECEKKEEP